MKKVIKIQVDLWEEEVMKAEEPVVVDFWHNMCGWCLKLNPVFAQLPEHFHNVKFAKVNILEKAENRQIAMDHGVLGTPTIKVFCVGRDVICYVVSTVQMRQPQVCQRQQLPHLRPATF